MCGWKDRSSGLKNEEINWHEARHICSFVLPNMFISNVSKGIRKENKVMLELIEQLSPRRRECFDYMILGYGYKQIGAEMNISVGAVGNHAYRVLHKLDIPDRLTLILKYYNLPNWMD